VGPLAAHGRRHSAGGAPNWGGAGHPKEKEGAAAPSTEVHRGPGGPLAEPKAAGVTPAAVNPRRGCRRGEEEVGGDGGGRAGSKGRKERKGKKGREREREGKEMAGLGVSSPASWWPETPATVVAGGASASLGKEKKKKKIGENEGEERKKKRKRERKERG